MKSSIARPLVLITIFALPCAPGGQQEKETKVSPRFTAAYSQFVKEFRKLNHDGARRELIRETSQQLNVMLKGRLSGPEADELLKQMKSVRLLHLQPSFVEAIDDPDAEGAGVFRRAGSPPIAREAKEDQKDDSGR